MSKTVIDNIETKIPSEPSKKLSISKPESNEVSSIREEDLKKEKETLEINLKKAIDILKAYIVGTTLVIKYPFEDVHPYNLDNALKLRDNLQKLIIALNDPKSSPANILSSSVGLLMKYHPYTQGKFWKAINQIIDLPSFHPVKEDLQQYLPGVIDRCVGVGKEPVAVRLYEVRYLLKTYISSAKKSVARLLGKVDSSDCKNTENFYKELTQIEKNFYQNGELDSKGLVECLKRYRPREKILRYFEGVLSKEELSLIRESITPKTTKIPVSKKEKIPIKSFIITSPTRKERKDARLELLCELSKV